MLKIKFHIISFSLERSFKTLKILETAQSKLSKNIKVFEYKESNINICKVDFFVVYVN